MQLLMKGGMENVRFCRRAGAQIKRQEGKGFPPFSCSGFCYNGFCRASRLEVEGSIPEARRTNPCLSLVEDGWLVEEGDVRWERRQSRPGWNRVELSS